MKASFEQYSSAYQHVAMRREDGILEVTLHSDGDSMIWGDGPHTELGYAFADIGSDPGNRVVILTGAGERFLGALDSSWVGKMHPAKWDKIYQHGRRLLMNLLEIEVPVIAAVNGPARVHAELAVMSDIVLASDTADFQDAPHFRKGTVPSDGVHLIWPALLGPNRGRYFLLTGQRLTAVEAKEWGVVNEVIPRVELMDRAWALARDLARQPDTALRYARAALTHEMKQVLSRSLGFGLALEGLGAYESWPEE
ncbi:enoyl-CoA hydratase/isomerase family protein [Rhodococcus sp. MS16]|uniref:enoyl-CoA hydratase/isomerase family protein n=1 Tax=Rhodococcus TaxID=1827 RepID=UPI0015628A52|nr:MULTISPECIES: enoyl-CoA hydratase/isomerase family protein [Rhodococcus]MCE4267546.1 enoyl-CoA hydratase/isomerase family protein [Rhodococcus globerulus]NRI68718.1 enoyl-CoA hydratase/isomerase family protein [Rhodococcus sp. MS16]